jgi:hypothetical protein
MHPVVRLLFDHLAYKTGLMKYTPTLLLIFLLLAVKFGKAQEELTHYPKVDSILSTDVRKTSIEQFLKFRPTYKLLSCIVRIYSKGEIVQFPYPEDKEHTTFVLMKRSASKGDVITFDNIDVMNGEKKIRLTPKAYLVK